LDRRDNPHDLYDISNRCLHDEPYDFGQSKKNAVPDNNHVHDVPMVKKNRISFQHRYFANKKVTSS
jgi:hypothetical protein